mgnify:FL=1
MAWGGEVLYPGSIGNGYHYRLANIVGMVIIIIAGAGLPQSITIIIIIAGVKQSRSGRKPRARFHSRAGHLQDYLSSVPDVTELVYLLSHLYVSI